MDNICPLTNKELWSLIDYGKTNITHEDYRIIRKINKESFYQFVDKQIFSLHINEHNHRFEGIHIRCDNLL